MECPKCKSVCANDQSYCGHCGTLVDARLLAVLSNFESSLSSRFAEVTRQNLENQKVIENEITERVAEKLIGWGKIGAYLIGVPLALLIIILGYFGISSLRDLDKLQDTVQHAAVKATQLTIQIDTLYVAIAKSTQALQQLPALNNSVDRLSRDVGIIKDTSSKASVPSVINTSGMIKGIDLSRFNRIKDYSAIKRSGLSFAFVKATEGKYRDASFRVHFSSCKNAGLTTGAYHFFRFGTDAKEQALFFLENIKGLRSDNDLPPVLDIEDTRDNLSQKQCEDAIEQWLTIVRDELGVKPIILTGKWYWGAPLYLNNSPKFKEYPLWTQRYGNSYLPMYGGWKTPTFWQYTDRAALDGQEDTAGFDLNYFLGSEEDLKEFIKNSKSIN